MKTTTELFLAFTTGRKPAFTYGANETFSNAKVYDISPKQYQWLSSLIFKKFNSLGDSKGLVSASQYSETINGFSYSIIGNKKLRIRVYELPVRN